MENQTKKVEISFEIVFKTIMVVLGIWFLFLVRDVILLLFISVIIVASISPIVDWMQKKKIPRSVGTLLVYLFLFLFIGLIVSFLIPPIVEQFYNFSKDLPDYLISAENSFSETRNFFQSESITFTIQNILNNLGDDIANLHKNIFSKTIGVFSGIFSAIVVFSMAFYMSMEKDGIKKFIVSIVPEKKKEYASVLTSKIEEKIGRWMIGQIFLAIIVFALVFLGLSIIGVPYALILAILAGVLEIVPYIGPIVSAIPGIILGFLVSPTVGFLAIFVYIIVQQVENNIIVPQVMKKAVGINPITTIVAVIIGFKLAGVLGAIVAVPVATALSIFVLDFIEKD